MSLGDCALTDLTSCGSYEDPVTNEYCCHYILGTSESHQSQQQLFDTITIIRILNIATLIIDYGFSTLRLLAWVIYYSIYKSNQNHIQLKFKSVATSMLMIIALGSVIDIISTSAIIIVFRLYKLLPTLFTLYNSNCYSSVITLKQPTLQSQFQTVYSLAITKGVLAIINLFILTLLSCGRKFKNQKRRLIYGVGWAVLNLIIISFNVFRFVQPAYDTFKSSYDNEKYLCFVRKSESADRWNKDIWIVVETYGIGYLVISGFFIGVIVCIIMAAAIQGRSRSWTNTEVSSVSGVVSIDQTSGPITLQRNSNPNPNNIIVAL